MKIVGPPGLNIIGPSSSGIDGLPVPSDPSSFTLVLITSPPPPSDAIILLNIFKEDVSSLPLFCVISLLLAYTTIGCGLVNGGKKPNINPLALTVPEAVIRLLEPLTNTPLEEVT